MVDIPVLSFGYSQVEYAVHTVKSNFSSLIKTRYYFEQKYWVIRYVFKVCELFKQIHRRAQLFSLVGWANSSIVCPRGTVETVGKQKDACPPYETVLLLWH
jgi:hypothetical protein